MNEYCVENKNHNQQIYVWVYKEYIKLKKMWMKNFNEFFRIFGKASMKHN